MDSSEDRRIIVREAIAALKKDAGFHELVQSCANCQHLDEYDGDGSGYDETYSFCGNPDNEWQDARPGEHYTWKIYNPSCSVCNRWDIAKRRW